MENDAINIDYKETQVYKLGLVYQQLGLLLMDPQTGIEKLLGFCNQIGFQLKIEIIGGDVLGE